MLSPLSAATRAQTPVLAASSIIPCSSRIQVLRGIVQRRVRGHVHCGSATLPAIACTTKYFFIRPPYVSGSVSVNLLSDGVSLVHCFVERGVVITANALRILRRLYGDCK